MVVVSGIVFVVLRALLALCPPGRLPIKRWAALAALVAATFYLLLSGAEVATQRSVDWIDRPFPRVISAICAGEQCRG
jgi:competence protein ComEC